MTINRRLNELDRLIGSLYENFISGLLPEKQYKKIKPAIDYINENFTNGKLSVGKLSAICGISESALKKLFIKKFGVPPVIHNTA